MDTVTQAAIIDCPAGDCEAICLEERGHGGQPRWAGYSLPAKQTKTANAQYHEEHVR